MGCGEGGRAGQEVAFFGALAKVFVSSSIALAGREFLPKSCLLVKYSPLCNLQTETFLQNPIHTFLVYQSLCLTFCVGVACSGKKRNFCH